MVTIMIIIIIIIMDRGELETITTLKREDRISFIIIMQKMNKAIKYFQTTNVTDTNNLLKAVSMYVAEKLGVKTTRSDGRRKEP